MSAPAREAGQACLQVGRHDDIARLAIVGIKLRQFFVPPDPAHVDRAHDVDQRIAGL